MGDGTLNRCNVPSIEKIYLEADRDAVGILIGLVTKQGTCCDVLVTPETVTFRYRSLFLGSEALNFFRPILLK